MNLVTTPGDGVYANNTFHITAITVIGGFIWLIMGASVAGEAAARDIKMRMHLLMYTTTVKKLDYLGGKFLAAFSVNALLILSLPVGVLLSFYLPGMDQDELLPFRPLAYLNVYFLIALPNVFVVTAMQFSFAALSRQVITSYLASFLIALVTLVIATSLAKLFGNQDLVKLLDPGGVAGIVGSELSTWTPTEKNTRLVTLKGMFLWNRILWMSVAIGSLFFTFYRFNFTNIERKNWLSRFKRRTKAESKKSEEFTIISTSGIAVPQIERRFGFETSFCQTLNIARATFRNLARHPLGITVIAAIIVISLVFSSQIMTQFGIPLLPTTGQVLEYLTPNLGNLGTPWVVIPLLIIYFTGELIWKEREAGQSYFEDALPVPEWALLSGKFLGLVLIIVAWMALLMAGGIGMQLVLNYDKLEIGLYLNALFLFQFADYLLFALLSLVVHVVVNQKYIGYLVMLLVFSFIAFPSTFKVEHPMLIYGEDPGWWYTDIRGFGPTLGPWLWFKAYWIAWALLLAIAAGLLWARGREQSFKYRIRLAKRRFTGSTTRLAIIALALIVTLGSFIFYNTNVLNDYQTSADINERKAEYERRYARFRNLPQPVLTSTTLHAEIYPGNQQVEIRAVYNLVNKDTVPIDSIHFGSVSGIVPHEVNFNRAASGVVIDDKHSHFIYELEQPLLPGDSLQLKFTVKHKQHGFRHNGTNTLVMKNGTYFTNYDLLPSIGYQHYRELNDAAIRKKYNLAARPAIPSLYNLEARKAPFSADQTTFEAIIGTENDEVAVAPGRLQKTWTKGERRYFQYKTDASIGGEYAILSSNYALHKSKWNDIAIMFYYHPDHSLNINRMLRSVKASLQYYTEQFGPYPYAHLTIAERAGAGDGASADASIIYYGEQYALMNPDDSPDGFDLPYYILAHEIAHQWWGMARLTPAHVEGAGVLVEGLSVYSGMQVLENNYGEGHLRKYLLFLHSSYEMPGSPATHTLLQANESFLYYRKGGLAMYALSKYIGKEKVNAALRNLLQKHHTGELPLPTTLDLYYELQKVTPDSFNYLLHDLFRKNTYWRLKTKQIAGEQTKAGDWQVTLKIHAQKLVVDSAGNETIVPMNDWLEVGFYEEVKGVNKPLYLRMHRIRSGEQTIKVILPRKPDSGGIDPNYLMIDTRLDDNMMQLNGD